MRAATLLALMGVSRPIYHLIILNEAILIVLSNHINIMLLPASHVTYTVYNFTDLINNSVCLSVCLSAKCCFAKQIFIHSFVEIYFSAEFFKDGDNDASQSGDPGNLPRGRHRPHQCIDGAQHKSIP